MSRLGLVSVAGAVLVGVATAVFFLPYGSNRAEGLAGKSLLHAHQTRLADDGQSQDDQDPGDQIQVSEQQEEQQEGDGGHA